MYPRVSNAETVYQHWFYRGDLVGQSSANGNLTPALQRVGVCWYDLTVGRFLRVDSWLESIYLLRTLNGYGYCLNDPVQCVDPSGAWYVKVGISIDIGFGAGVGLEVGIAIGTDPAGRLRGAPYVSGSFGGSSPNISITVPRIGFNPRGHIPPPGTTERSGIVGACARPVSIDMNVPLDVPKPGLLDLKYGIGIDPSFPGIAAWGGATSTKWF